MEYTFFLLSFDWLKTVLQRFPLPHTKTEEFHSTRSQISYDRKVLKWDKKKVQHQLWWTGRLLVLLQLHYAALTALQTRYVSFLSALMVDGTLPPLCFIYFLCGLEVRSSITRFSASSSTGSLLISASTFSPSFGVAAAAVAMVVVSIITEFALHRSADDALCSACITSSKQKKKTKMRIDHALWKQEEREKGKTETYEKQMPDF